MKRKIVGMGKYSAGVSLPRDIIRNLGWRMGQMLDLSVKGKTIHIKDYKNCKKQ